jgi:hypothetical protein
LLHNNPDVFVVLAFFLDLLSPLPLHPLFLKPYNSGSREIHHAL